MFNFPLRLTCLVCSVWLCVCMSACPQTRASLFLHLGFLIAVCSLLVGVWTGRLLSPAPSEAAAGPAVAQLPGRHWPLPVCHLLPPCKLRWARAIVSLGRPSLPLLGESWHLVDKRRRNSRSSLSTFLYSFHHPPRGPPVKWTTVHHSFWKISSSSGPDSLCVPALEASWDWGSPSTWLLFLSFTVWLSLVYRETQV